MKIYLLALSLLALSACATRADSGDASEERTYRTGSHLPVKDGATGAKTQDPAQMNIPPNMQRPGGMSGG